MSRAPSIRAALGLLFLLSCDSSHDSSQAGTVEIAGTATSADGISAASLEVAGQIFVIAHSEAPPPNCPTVTQHRAPIRFQTDAAGNFEIEAQASDFVPISHAGCPLDFSNQRIQAIRLDAFTASESKLCQSYCLKRNGAVSESCLNECSSSARLRSSARLEGAKLHQEGSRIKSEFALAFTGLSSTLSSSDQSDLQLDAESTRTSVSFEERWFAPDSCPIQEGCLSGSGKRKLLTFDTTIQNTGSAPLLIGDPTSNPNSHFDACHQHYHLGNTMAYQLVSLDGTTIASGRKQGFCIMDTIPTSGAAPSEFTCDYQGISPGWSDVYDRSLDCQWIDVTDAPPGDYLLRLETNPALIFEESDYSNNSVEIEVTIPA